VIEGGAAILGTGFMGMAHAEALRRIGVPIAGVLGSSAEKSRRAALECGARKAYGSLAEALDDPEARAVHVALPNKLHHEAALRALEAGKHVLCEKPLAMTSRETGDLVEAARGRPRQACAVNYNIRFYPLAREAAERVRRGDIGDVLHVAGSYVQDWLLLDTDYNWRVLADEGGALRAVADIGTHWLDLIRAVTGLEIESVCADLRTVHETRRRPRGEVETFGGAAAGIERVPVTIDTEDYGAVIIRFRGGARGVLWVSQVTAGRKNLLRFEIAGSRRALAWESERPEELWIGRRDGPSEVLPKDPAILGGDARAAAGYPGGHIEGYPDTFKQLFRAFYGRIAAGQPPTGSAPALPTFEDGHREVLICEAILRSHREGRWVSIDMNTGVKS